MLPLLSRKDLNCHEHIFVYSFCSCRFRVPAPLEHFQAQLAFPNDLKVIITIVIASTS